MNLKSFIAIDLESTGLDDSTDEIIEVALVRFENGVVTSTFECLVKPGQVVRPFIYTLTGINPEELAQAKTFAEVAQEIVAFIGKDPLVAHNASFDSRFLRHALTRVGVTFEQNAVLDTLLLSRIVWQSVANHRLETLIESQDIIRSASHRALPDAQACGELFLKALDMVDLLSPYEKHQIALLAAGTDWERVFPKSELAEAPVLKLREANMPLHKGPPPRHPGRVMEYFEPGGVFSKTLPGFHPNENQAHFAEIEERNLHKGGIAVLEAGTGTGKTLGYLLPAALKAVNSGERVVISTATRSLQEQLWQKDLPSITPLFGDALRPALVKGRSNYLCLRKFQEHLDHADTLLSLEEREAMMPLISWVERTETGDANENSGFHIGRNRQLWNKLASESASCVGQSCQFFQQCFGLGARRKAASANLVLVNHALFLQDFALDFALLPTYEHIIFDEAHRIPAAAHEAFGKRVWFFRFRNQVKILAHVKNPQMGLLSEIEHLIAASTQEGLADAVNPLAEKVRTLAVDSEKHLHRFFLKIGKNIKRFNDKDGLRYSNSLVEETQSDPKPVLQSIHELLEAMDALCLALVPETKALGYSRDIEGCNKEITAFLKDLEFVAHAQRPEWAFWMVEPGNPHTIVLFAQLLEPGKRFAEKFYPWIKSALFTSATLSVQGDLEYFQDRMGMFEPSLSEEKRPFARILENPFDVDANRRILIADFLPKPNDPGFQKAMDEVLCAILPEMPVSSMVLFTALSALGKSHEAMSPLFAAKGKTLLSQHTDGAIDNLVEIFRKKKGSCLIGAQMLWEGIDLPGDALEFLVIPKLPFPTPGDALIQARGDLVKNRGGNSFKDIFIPEAVLALRQGLGRLIRGKDDKGTVLLLDPRLIHENYGKSFTRIWAGKHIVVHSIDEIKKELGL